MRYNFMGNVQLGWRPRGAGVKPRGGVKWRLQLLGGALLVLWLSASARAGTGTESGESLTISLLTMGPGEHPFTKFGHSAIWVHDARTNHDEVYNFGTFAFDSPTLLLDSV